MGDVRIGTLLASVACVAGGDYPANLTVEVHLDDGSLRSYAIDDPLRRYD